MFLCPLYLIPGSPLLLSFRPLFIRDRFAAGGPAGHRTAFLADGREVVMQDLFFGLGHSSYVILIGMDYTNSFSLFNLHGDHFASWPDDIFFAWLGGFFDGEGCIYLPKGPGVEVSVANTEAGVIHSIHKRLHAGVITEVKFLSNNWKTKYHWRLRNLPEVYELLLRMRPFLTIKAAKADLALAKARKYLDERAAIVERNNAILEMLKTHKKYEVAAHFGVTRQTVYSVARHGRPYNVGPRSRPINPETLRKSNQIHRKELVQVHTQSTIISE